MYELQVFFVLAIVMGSRALAEALSSRSGFVALSLYFLTFGFVKCSLLDTVGKVCVDPTSVVGRCGRGIMRNMFAVIAADVRAQRLSSTHSTAVPVSR